MSRVVLERTFLNSFGLTSCLDFDQSQYWVSFLICLEMKFVQFSTLLASCTNFHHHHILLPNFVNNENKSLNTDFQSHVFTFANQLKKSAHLFPEAVNVSIIANCIHIDIEEITS